MLQKTCTKCFLQKPIEDFGWKDRTINKRHAVCKECTAKRSSDWYYAIKERQKGNVRINNKLYRQQARQFVLDYLVAHPCIQCGENDPRVLEVHHKRNKE